MEKGDRFKVHGHTDWEQKTSWSLIPDKNGPYVYDPDHEFPAKGQRQGPIKTPREEPE